MRKPKIRRMRDYHRFMDSRMFDFADFYTGMAKRLPKGAVIAEVGVADGTSAIYLAEALLNMDKPFKLHMIDNLAYGGGDQLQTILRHICAADLGEYVEVIPFDSLTACCRYPDGYFDFVFLDSSHKVESTKAEIREWYYKINEGGYLAGHDYNDGEGREVKLAVDIVIPNTYTRTDVVGALPERLLEIEQTEKDLGLWWIQKKFYVKLN